MIKPASIILSLLFCSSTICAQENHAIQEITNYEGKILPYITEQAFREMKIDGVLPLGRIINTDSITAIIDQLGEPMEVKETADTASTGMILFRYRDVEYPGMIIHYEQYDTFLPTVIAITSEHHFLELSGDTVRVGRTPGQISAILESVADTTETDSFRLWVFQNTFEGRAQKDEKGNIIGGYRYILFRMDPVSQQITGIRIVVKPI